MYTSVTRWLNVFSTFCFSAIAFITVQVVGIIPKMTLWRITCQKTVDCSCCLTFECTRKAIEGGGFSTHSCIASFWRAQNNAVVAHLTKEKIIRIRRKNVFIKKKLFGMVETDKHTKQVFVHTQKKVTL